MYFQTLDNMTLASECKQNDKNCMITRHIYTTLIENILQYTMGSTVWWTQHLLVITKMKEKNENQEETTTDMNAHMSWKEDF